MKVTAAEKSREDKEEKEGAEEVEEEKHREKGAIEHEVVESPTQQQKQHSKGNNIDNNDIDVKVQLAQQQNPRNSIDNEDEDVLNLLEEEKRRRRDSRRKGKGRRRRSRKAGQDWKKERDCIEYANKCTFLHTLTTMKETKGRLGNLHLELASSLGPRHEITMKAAMLFEQALDAEKTRSDVKLPDEWEDVLHSRPERPHFMLQRRDKRRRRMIVTNSIYHYQDKGILGRLFDKAEQLRTRAPPFPFTKDENLSIDLRTAAEETKQRYEYAYNRIQKMLESWLQRRYDEDYFDDDDDDDLDIFGYESNENETNGAFSHSNTTAAAITTTTTTTTAAAAASTSTPSTQTPSWIGNIKKLRRCFVSAATAAAAATSGGTFKRSSNTCGDCRVRSSNARNYNGNRSRGKETRTKNSGCSSSSSSSSNSRSYQHCSRFPENNSSEVTRMGYECSCDCYCYLFESKLYHALDIELRKALAMEARIWYTADFDVITNLAKSNKLEQKMTKILQKEKKKSKNKLTKLFLPDASILSARILKLVGVIPFYIAEAVLLDIKKESQNYGATTIG